jgi:hypothetical protein
MSQSQARWDGRARRLLRSSCRRRRHHPAGEFGRPPPSRLTETTATPSATVGGGEGTRLRRVLLRWQAPQPCPTHQRLGSRGPARGGDPTATPTSIPTAFPPPQMAYPLPPGGWITAGLAPLGGSGAAAPSGALRAIDSSAWPRFRRTCGPHRLRRQMGAGAISTPPWPVRSGSCRSSALLKLWRPWRTAPRRIAAESVTRPRPPPLEPPAGRGMRRCLAAGWAAAPTYFLLLLDGIRRLRVERYL